MCGIAGFLGTYTKADVAAMNAAQAHRGPDGEGVFHASVTDPVNIGLGHVRLAIVGLNACGAQPMHHTSPTAAPSVLLYNGELYNWQALSQELGLKNPQCDTQILQPLLASEVSPEQALQRLNGMFALALWQPETQELLLARDHVGIKPLYYLHTEKGLLFASEMRALLPHVSHQSEAINHDALADHLTYIWSPSEATWHCDIKKLRPGHLLRAQVTEEGGVSVAISPWHTPKLDPIPKQPQTPEALWQLFEEVVADQCMADVPVGAFLSGGVDSTAIVAAMQRRGIMPTQTYCVKFVAEKGGTTMADEGFSDDFVYAQQAAKHLGVPLEAVEVGSEGLQGILDAAEMLEEPLADPAPLYVQAISKRAREAGIKVLLSGTGGDDVFSGYRRHSVAKQAGVLPQWVRRTLGLGAQGAARVSQRADHSAYQRRLEKLAYMLSGTGAEFLNRSFEFTPRATVQHLMQHTVQAWPENDLTAAITATNGQDTLLRRMLLLEQCGFLPDHNLTYTDKASMAESLEVRVPFLDTRLMDWAMQLPDDQLVKGFRKPQAKWLLKEAVKPHLPKGFFDRPKAGFGAPIRAWIQENGNAVERTLFDTHAEGAGRIFHMNRLKDFYHQNQKGRLDGAYTLLSAAMMVRVVSSLQNKA